MAKKKETVIIKKVVHFEGEQYEGAVTKKSPIEYALTINAVVIETVKTETKQKEVIESKQKKLRPIAAEGETLSAAEKTKRQKSIDKYLEGVTISEALELVEDKDENGKKIKLRAAQKELSFPVEMYIEEVKEVIEVPVIKDEIKTSSKKVVELPFYFRPNGQHITKSIQNYLKSKS